MSKIHIDNTFLYNTLSIYTQNPDITRSDVVTWLLLQYSIDTVEDAELFINKWMDKLET